MKIPKGDELDYIHFLVAAQQVFTATEAARIRKGEPNAPAYDAYTRLLKRIPPDTQALWREVASFPRRDRGYWWWTIPFWTSRMLARWPW